MLNASDPLSNPLRKLFQTTVSFRSALGGVLRSTISVSSEPTL